MTSPDAWAAQGPLDFAGVIVGPLHVSRLPSIDGVPRRVMTLVRELMAAEVQRVDAARITTLAGAHPFGADELAGMLRGLFDASFRQSCSLERDDRLRVALAPGVVREPWR